MRILGALACCAAGVVGGFAWAGETAPTFRMELELAYGRWAKGPGDMLGFWGGAPDETHRRTGANASSAHESLWIVRSVDGSDTPALHPLHAGPRAWVRCTFDAAEPFEELRIFVSTAADGSAAEGTLTRLDEKAAPVPGHQANARVEPWLVFGGTGTLPTGRYIVEVRASKGAVDVWPEPAPAAGYTLEEPTGQLTGDGRLLRAELRLPGGKKIEWHTESAEPYHIPVAKETGNASFPGYGYGHGVGEHNNPFFVRYPEWFEKAYPQAFMQDVNGGPIGVDNPIIGGMNRMPAVDDATLTELSCRLIRMKARKDRGNERLRYWVIGGEESYPDFFGLPPGDFRPDSLTHYRAYLGELKETRPLEPQRLVEPAGTGDWAAWQDFRERAVADRAAHYMQAFLAEDGSRPVFYPTHGNVFFEAARRHMGHAPAMMAGASDGFETGQIAVGTDDELLNLLTLNHMAAYGVPVVTPRLANKTLDPAALGGGRSFTPEMLRRLVYECLGMGIGHIGLVQWEGDIADGEWHIKDTPAEKECAAVYGEIERARPVLAGMGRVQPRIGLYTSDATWLLQGWNAAWTGFFQDVLDRGWNVSIVGDAQLGPMLAERMPVLVSIDNVAGSREAVEGLRAYLSAGGRVIQSGPLFEKDDRLAPSSFVADSKQLVALGEARQAQTRELVNQASTSRGAYVQKRTYRPVDADVVERAIRDSLPDWVFGPVALDGGDGTVACFPLTDGETLLAVLINRSAAPVRVSLKLRDKNAQDLRGRLLVSEASDRIDTIDLAARGTAMVWFSQPCEGSAADEAVARAKATLATWRDAHVDTATADARLELAQRAGKAGMPAKELALAKGITSSLGVRLERVGGAVTATVLDAQGTALPHARVECRVVPGPFLWLPMAEREPGQYEAKLDRLPRVYDPATRRYAEVSGPMRIVCRASDGRRTGGAMLTTGAVK